MSKISPQQYIIAMGASAGGLDAISAFFDYTPLDAVSYIVIQHLSADYKSLMADLLSRHSKLQVVEAADGMEVASNKVYIIPSAHFMTIKNGRLALSDKKDKERPHFTIDCFFASLAEALGNKAIGIVFSGTGRDGSAGIEAIKKAGGLIIVQDPDTAAFKDMPVNAIASGYTDMILSPQAMPQIIEEYVKDGKLESLSDNPADEISEQELSGVIALIKGNLPLDFTDYKRPTILRRIKRRMVQNALTSGKAYYELLKNNPVELEILANDFLISVTAFFRDPEAFTIIEKQVIPQIMGNKKPGESVKIWIAGCATGEEAYSLAILVKEYLLSTQSEREVKIFATDINKAALDTASKGIYTDKIEKNVSRERLRHFFTKTGQDYKVNHEVRKMLIFAQHNLVSNPPYCNVDLISCRNLLIYLNPVLQKKVFSMMHFGLNKGGFLFLGPSENAAILKDDFAEIDAKWNILQSNKTGTAVRFNALTATVIDGIKTTTIETGSTIHLPLLIETDNMNGILWEESGFTGIGVDEHLRVFQSFGNPAAYLKQEILQFNLNELLPHQVALPVKAAAHKAFTNHEKVIIEGLNFSTDKDKPHWVKIIMRPYLKKGSKDKLLLMLFIEIAQDLKTANLTSGVEVDELTRAHLVSLENELEQYKHQLKVSQERIAATNENMQSFNEELLSANEEMQSANEELQSVNEELQTINKEHQITNATLTELNDDLNNYFRSNLNGQLFVDRDLLLKKYSPAAVKHINIRESHIGRPLSNITTNLPLTSLLDDIRRVINNDETIIREATSINGNVYQVTTMPYIKKDSSRPDGAIISFYDITELKHVLQVLGNSNKGLLRINADLNNFVYSASHDLNAPIFNIEMLLNILNRSIDLKDPKILEISEMIHRSINNFKAVTEDLVKVGSVEATMNEESELENIEEMFAEIMGIISERIRIANARFSTDFAAKEVRFPKKNLRSILLNLSTNAIKFSAPGRTAEISVTTENGDGYTILTVTDNGIGIKNNKLDSIFTLYKRLNPDIDGQGVGLYLIKRMVDAYGGKVSVDSELGKGSCFRIYFKKDETVSVAPGKPDILYQE